MPNFELTKRSEEYKTISKSIRKAKEDQFIKIKGKKIDAYKNDRDFPNLSGTSYLSIHLRFGNISIREILRQTLQHQIQ